MTVGRGEVISPQDGNPVSMSKDDPDAARAGSPSKRVSGTNAGHGQKIGNGQNTGKGRNTGYDQNAGSKARLRDFSRSLPMALLRAREAVMRQFRPALRAVNLTEQQWRVLRALSAVQEIEATQLAKATFLLAPSLTRILRDLDQRGLIDRRADPADQRTALLSLSGEGRALIEEAGIQSERIYRQLTARLGQERLETLMRLLVDIERDLAAPLSDREE